MDTSQIKRFAVAARNILKQGVINRIAALGFNDKGEVEERNKPQHLQGNTLFMGQLYDENFYGKWMALYNRVQTKGIKEVYEEAAYTWFNRLMAIRIMEKNGFTEPVLAFDDDRFRIPRIVSNARAGQFSVDSSDREKLSELLMDDTKTTEQFTLLITSFCHTNPIISNCFGSVSDYTEILLPTNILSEGGFVDLLNSAGEPNTTEKKSNEVRNHTAFITDDDYRQSELIGWLYQFYISEKKDEVFASFKRGKKAEAEDIPAATQIFTPNWIVKYMVQNTVGRIFLDNNSNSNLKDKWKYLVEPSSPTPDGCIFKYDDPKELTMADLGCGSGHILNEGFGILYDIYLEEGYSRKQAVENIFKYNLTGVDLDTRAKQLATFALMMKACQKDDSFLDCHVMPNVLDMPDVDRYSFIEADGHFCCAYSLEWDNEQKDKIHLELVRAFELLKQAHNLGSIMKFDLSDFTMKYIKRCVELYEEDPKYPNPFATLIHAYKLILTLTQKYASLVMNPPYMGSGNMNQVLADYVKNNYPEGKADLFAAFMEVAIRRLAEGGKYGMINMHSWMFLSSFEKLRRSLLDNEHIDSLLHLGPRTFDELSGEVVQNVAFVITKASKEFIPKEGTIFPQLGKNISPVREQKGTYYRLVDGKNCRDKERMFLDAQANHTAKVYYPNVEQSNFEKIPGCPIAYWVDDIVFPLYSNDSIHNVSSFKRGIGTGDNDRFLRFWFEVSNYYIDFGDFQSAKWQKYNKGGSPRRWYGNREYIINWDNNGYDIINNYLPNGKQASRPQNLQFNFKKNISYSSLTSTTPTFRVYENFINDQAGNYFIVNNDDEYNYLLGLLNSRLLSFFKGIKNVTLNITADDLLSVPFVEKEGNNVSPFVIENIFISKTDWDSHETSWDFETNPLVALRNEKVAQGNLEASFRLSDLVEKFETQWTERFMQLHENEEELNRQFISIYGLEDELTPDVPLSEITILQQGEISIETNIGNE